MDAGGIRVVVSERVRVARGKESERGNEQHETHLCLCETASSQPPQLLWPQDHRIHHLFTAIPKLPSNSSSVLLSRT